MAQDIHLKAYPHHGVPDLPSPEVEEAVRALVKRAELEGVTAAVETALALRKETVAILAGDFNCVFQDSLGEARGLLDCQRTIASCGPPGAPPPRRLFGVRR